METYSLKLERLFTDKRLPAVHIAKLDTGQVYDPESASFSQVAAGRVAADQQQGPPLIEMTPGEGLLTGLYVAEVPITPAFTDGWYIAYYHDMLTNAPNGTIFLWECFQVSGGKPDPYQTLTAPDVAAEVMKSLRGVSFRIEATIG